MRAVARVTVGVASPSRRATSPGVRPSSSHKVSSTYCWPSCTPWRENAAPAARVMACLAAQKAALKSGSSAGTAGQPRRIQLGVCATSVESIETTTSTLCDLSGGTGPLVAHLENLAAQGIDHVLLAARPRWHEAAVEALATALPELHALPTRAAA